MYIPWSLSCARRFGESRNFLVECSALPFPRPFPAAWSFGASRRKERSMAFKVRRSVAISRETEVVGFGIVISLSRVNGCTAGTECDALEGENTSRGAGRVSMRPSVSLYYSLSLSFTGSWPPFSRLFTFPGPRASTKGTLARGSALLAGLGTVSGGAKGACAAASMAEARARTE